ncbi:MAG: amidohydrolase family protein [Pyrinomonadaceae bacterium]
MFKFSRLIIIAYYLTAFVAGAYLIIYSFTARHVVAASNRAQTVDVLIKGGKVFDGSGAEGVVEDIGIKNDRIMFIGDKSKSKIDATRTIDARGLIVAPGFIDPHTHTLEDLSNPERKANEDYLMQGVTTVITGNDGGSPLDIADKLNLWRKQGIGTNAALLIGHGTVRRKVLGMNDVAPSAAQLEQMKSLVARAMDEGAFGMSTGLFYAPGSYAKTEEVIELAKIAAARGGIYDTHMRSESTGLIASVKETIRIGREAKIPVHISHLKAFGKEQWGQSETVISLVKQARASGVDVTANQYPYTASGTSLVASLVPRWAEVGGRAMLLKRIDDPNMRSRLIGEMEANLKVRGGAETLLIINTNEAILKPLIGKRLDAVARERGATPVETALQIIKTGDMGVASFSMNESDIENFMRQDFVMTGSDGSTGHPRKYGTFPRKLHEYVFKRKIISLPFAIHASSALTAKNFHIPQRGFLREGFYADIVVFDENTISDRATYDQPEILSIGMKYVFVNGKLTIENGKYNGTLAGQALRK